MGHRDHAGRLRLATLALALGACGGGGKDAAVCRREAAELGELLATVDHEPPGFQAHDLTLVTRGDTPKTTHDFGPVIHVTREGAMFGGEPFQGEEGRARLAEQARRFRRGGKGEVLYVAIAEDARWADVASAAVLGWESGFERQGLVFARPPAAVTPPPRSKVDDELDRILHEEDPSNKATELARVIERIVKGCPALVRAFGSVAAVERESKADALIRAIEPALVECNCSVDMPSLRSALFRLLAVERPQSAFVITHDPAGALVDLPPDTAWRDAHARFSPDARVLIKLP